ncbi:MAG: hypothetical protein KKA05_06540 [Alphaproteobacteria bacterium]|nr:hypothetical protein [Alphaproteobacteria bacterium]MBU0859083.1 hypothetical protein [Alphaproteobacteria bacterium]
MSLSNGAFYLASGAALLGLALAVNSCQSAVYTAEEGRDYLHDKGYTNIQGGERDYFNNCGEDAVARSYSAQNPQGRTVNQVVCFRPLLGPYRPLF